MTDPTEKQKMLAGELYDASDSQLVAERTNARRLTRVYNSTSETELTERTSLLEKLLAKNSTGVFIEPPFRCDYGYNIYLGEYVYMNFGCIFLDVNRIEVGEQTMFGPNVQVLTATHPLNAAKRCEGRELGIPIKIGKRVWIGGGVVICPGVVIGDDTTIGAGSVVTKDVPSNVFAAGNPCRVIRKITQ
jgi:maltose O-acetyltransferase